MKWSRARIILISTVSGFVLLAVGTAAGAAIASGPIDSSGVIHGCYTSKAKADGSFTFVLELPGTTCPVGDTAISWNQQGPQGLIGPAGPAGATGPQGPKGDTGAQGLPGLQGAPGPVGTDGNTVLRGTGAPDNTVGHDGDFYIDTAADMLYGPKASGAWPATGTSLVGPKGDTGDPGPAGPAGPQGPKGDTGATGPAGPAGTGLSSLDNLNGTPCNNGQGSTQISYGSDGTVTIQCATGSPSPSPSPSPTNTGPGTSQDLGSFTCNGLTTGGTIGAPPGAWFKFTWTGGCTGGPAGAFVPLEVKLAVTSSTGTGTPGFDLYSAGNLATPMATNTTGVTLDNNQTGDYYINVYNPGGGTFTYTLTVQPLIAP
jgi:Collagen triple helix repeat (20 copies)